MSLAKFPPAGPHAQISPFVFKHKGLGKELDKEMQPVDKRHFGENRVLRA